MVKNNGSRTNKQAFWERFSAIYGADRARADQPLFDMLPLAAGDADLICAAHSCSFVWCFNSALVILTPHNTIVAERFATFRHYCLMPVYARGGLPLTLFSWYA